MQIYLLGLFAISSISCQADPKSLPTASDDSYNVLKTDGSYEFGYANRDRGSSYHFSEANSRNVVRGKFGSRNPGTGRVDETIYTAGPRGYRPRGPNIHRKYNLNQVGPRPIGNRDDPLFDPSEDPSYSFSFRTPTYNRDESANRNADVVGRYSFIDDVGERHNVDYIAGKNTGFHVKTPYPDSNPRPFGPLRYAGKRPRGHSSVQRGLDGSYRFVSGGPDQRRTETSDSAGNVRGSYTYLDDRGKQHVVHYIAGPNIGYRVLKSSKDFPLYPFGPKPFPIRPVLDPYDGTFPPSAYDDYIFTPPSGENLNTAASGHIRPKPRPTSTPSSIDLDDFFANEPSGAAKPSKKPTDDGSSSESPNKGLNSNELGFGVPNKTPNYSDPNYDDDDEDVFGDSKPTKKPSTPPVSTTQRPSISTEYLPSSTSSPVETPRPISTSPRPSPSGSTSFPVFDPESTFNIYADDDESWDGRLGGTILRNLGHKSVNLPPGVAVRAHVQSIDILPYGSRLPSPSAHLEREKKSS